MPQFVEVQTERSGHRRTGRGHGAGTDGGGMATTQQPVHAASRGVLKLWLPLADGGHVPDDPRPIGVHIESFDNRFHLGRGNGLRHRPQQETGLPCVVRGFGVNLPERRGVCAEGGMDRG